MLSRFHLLPERNGRTDGQTDGRTYGQTDLLYEYRTSISFRAVSCFRDYSHVRRSCELYVKCYDLKNVHAGLLHRPMMLLVTSYSSSSSSSCMRVINHNWSATKQRLHPQSVAEISRHSVFSGDRIRQCGTSSGSRHMTVSVSRHFLLQAPQCPCSVRKRFSSDHCCRGRSKPGCRIGSKPQWRPITAADASKFRKT